MKFKTCEERAKMILDNMYLIHPIVKKYATRTGMDESELKSYAYEGLIIGIDKFDESLGLSLIAYLYKYITGYTLCGLCSIENSCYRKYYFPYLKLKEEIEKASGKLLQQDLSMLHQIADCMVEQNKITERYRKIFEESILFSMPESLNQHKQDLIYPEEALIYHATYDLCREEIRDVFSRFSLIEQEVVNGLYGLYNEKVQTLEELANKFHYTNEGIRKIKNRVFSKLDKNDLEKLHDFLEMFDAYVGDELGIVKEKTRKR